VSRPKRPDVRIVPTVAKRPRGRPRKPGPPRVVDVRSSVTVDPNNPGPTAAGIADMYRREAGNWPPGVGSQMAMWLRAVADALEAGDAVNTAVRAFHAIKDLEDFLHKIAPLVGEGQRHRSARARAAKAMKGNRWRWGNK
jgi:hypothetical protein